MNLTQEAVNDALKHNLSRDNTSKYLRSAGYAFGHRLFRVMWTNRDGEPRPGVTKGNVTLDAVQQQLPKPIAGGIIVAPDVVRKKLTGRRYLVTVAQNNTFVHPQFWQNLRAFAERKSAQILVGKISYNKAAWSRKGGQVADGDYYAHGDGLWYDPVLEPYFVTEQIKIAPRLVVCAELDIIPTAVNPLGGLDDYTGPNCGIVPHTRLAMKSYATMKHEPAKFMYTTGAVTQRNYIDRRQGQLASFHHVYGALFVEVNEDGTWFVRQINASDDGSFFDVGDAAPRVAVLGDIHIEKADPIALSATLGMLSELQPEHIIIHDLIDFTDRNHHNVNDPHFLATTLAGSGGVVEGVFSKAAKFIRTVQMVAPRSFVVVVKSNHDEAYDKWVRDGTNYPDPVNARFWHESNAYVYKAIESKIKPKVFNWALDRYLKVEGVNTDRLVLLEADDSLVIDNIQYGMHGHLGANGARGGQRAFRQMGIRSFTAHAHWAGIMDGNYQVGVLGKLDMGYNRGLSGWSHTNGLTWPNAKRTLITLQGHEWRGKDL